MISDELNKIDLYVNKTIKSLLPEDELISFLNGGSKRIRSKVAILYIKACDKNCDETIRNIILAGELIHNASLLHDDVIDDSKLRRGVTTIGEKYSQNISILCGDYLITEAVKLIMSVNNKQISNIFNKTVQNMAIAEIKQYFMREQKISIEDYIEICKGKTAGLFSAILESCAILLGIDISNSIQFGEIYGICYQIKNDLEEYSALQDKKNKICTVIDIMGIENTRVLLDNYKRELGNLLKAIPNNGFKLELEDIINKL